ncbi:nucleotidyltransferase, variant 2 [Orbilia ellipsospora]|uniref:Nucleotidyltransferase, variant 2 n=1 Tax=Orbilia ellipsospora TaxID=2528407 RepID=A0AAV9XI48_9PEZI
MHYCAICGIERAQVIRPKNGQKLCRSCFIDAFEMEIHTTILESGIMLTRGERIAIGASGGKDSTVLAAVLKVLNERYDYGVEFILLSIDEGIHGYRDDSLETVKRNAVQYGMELCILGYEALYGWTMDQVVEKVGKKGNCTYCGVFRRQALDRGAKHLNISHILTGHNADDIAETILMNFLRGDLPRLGRCAEIITASQASTMKRSKPLKYAYEKEIVLYAHYRGLDYFSTECVYSPEAFRGNARALLKDLEKIRPSSVLDIVRSGEHLIHYPATTQILKSGMPHNEMNKDAGISVRGNENEGGLLKMRQVASSQLESKCASKTQGTTKPQTVRLKITLVPFFVEIHFCRLTYQTRKHCIFNQ